MIGILYWLTLLASSIGCIYWCIMVYSHVELDEHNQELEKRINDAELAYLKTKKTQSRIKFKPDL